MEFIIMVCVVGFRYRVGGDSIRYEDNYDSIPLIKDLFSKSKWWLDFEYQPLWIIFASACKTISRDFVFLQIIQAIFVNSVFFYYGNKNCNHRFGFVFLYFFYGYLYFSCEILRESIAVAIFMISYKYLVNKSFFKYYIFCIIAFLFHLSAILLFFLPLVYSILSKISGIKSYLIILLMGAGASIIMQYAIINILSHFINAEILLNKAETVMEAGKLNIFGVISKILFLIPLILTGMYINKFYHKKQILQYNFIINIFLIISALSLVFQPLLRWTNYFYILYLYMLSDFIFSIKKSEWRKGATIAFCLFMIKNFNFYKSYPVLLLTENTSIQKYKMYYPYHSIFDEEEVADREYVAKKEFN